MENRAKRKEKSEMSASTAVENLEVFCRQVSSRSRENLSAFFLLFQEKHYGNALSIIGQEIDSMIRVVYLLTISDLDYRKKLVGDSVEGRGWKHKGTGKRITDREMVEVSTNFEFWLREAYKIRNGIIHLSNLHDYKERDPLTLIPKQDKREIIKHLRRYHGGPRHPKPICEEGSSMCRCGFGQRICGSGLAHPALQLLNVFGHGARSGEQDQS